MTKKVTFTFGRFQGPTHGHKKLIDKAISHAEETGGEHRIYTSQSQDSTKNPIPYDRKIGHLRKLFPDANVVHDPEAKTAFHVAKKLSGEGVEHATMIVGQDREEEFREKMGKYVRHPDAPDYDPKKHIALKSFKVVSAGQRDPDAKGVEGASGTKMREFVKKGDFKSFAQNTPTKNARVARGIFNDMKKNLKEEHMAEIGELNHEKFGPMLDTFVQFASKKLGIKSLPTHELKKDEMATSFAAYNPSEKHMIVVTKNRHPMDIYRSVAHELVHHKQNEDGKLGKDISKEGATGSDIENEANSDAGKVMRWYAKENPSTFKSGYVVESYLDEGINDPAKMKAVFLAGGPGSGKDFIMNRTLAGHGMSEINSDNALEHLMKKQGLDLKMPPSEDYERNLARGKAKNMTKEKERLAIAGRKGLIINGTADDPDKIATIKAELERNGYQTKMLFVNTNNHVSRQRNLERGLQGGRKIPDGTDENGVPNGSRDIRTEKWEAAQEAKEKLRNIFGDEHFKHVDNSEDLRQVTPERKKEVDNEHNQLFKHYKKFTSAPVESPAAKEYETTEKKKRSISDIRKTRATTMSQRPNKPKPDVKQPPYVPNASEIEQAKRLGVEHIGGGQFGKKAKGENVVSHASKKGQLTVIRDRLAEEKKMKGKDPCWSGYEMIGKKKKNGKEVPNCVPVDEAFEAFMEENTSADREWGTNSLTKIYRDATPGQSFSENPLFEKKKKVVLKKKLKTEDNNLPVGGLPVSDGIGPEFSRRISPSYIGFAGISESVESWINSDKTQNRFIEKYGENLAEQKLLEAAKRLNQITESNNYQAKSVNKLRENWEALGGRDMGMIGVQNKEELPETNLSSYKKKIHRMSTFEKKTFDEETPTWQRKEGKNPEGGLNQKGVASYRAANPGSKLKTAVTTKPSKLKPGSKAANRRKSFCARMSGMKKRLTSAKTANDPDSRINKSLRKWNCEE